MSDRRKGPPPDASIDETAINLLPSSTEDTTATNVEALPSATLDERPLGELKEQTTAVAFAPPLPPPARSSTLEPGRPSGPSDTLENPPSFSSLTPASVDAQSTLDVPQRGASRRVDRPGSPGKTRWASVALGAGVGLVLVVGGSLVVTSRDAPVVDSLPAPRVLETVKRPPPREPVVAPPPVAPEAKTGTVRVFSEPDANVFLDGRDLGPQPVTVQLPVGAATLLLVNDKLGLKRTVNFDVEPNDQNVQRVVFPRGWIEVDAPGAASVAVDGKPAAKTTVQVFEGSHRVEVGYDDKRHTHLAKTADVVGGSTTTVYFEAPSIADE